MNKIAPKLGFATRQPPVSDRESNIVPKRDFIRELTFVSHPSLHY
jgi:hypothetical protein